MLQGTNYCPDAYFICLLSGASLPMILATVDYSTQKCVRMSITYLVQVAHITVHDLNWNMVRTI